MNKDIYFKIAEHILHVSFSSELSIMNYLPSFEDFLIEEPTDKEHIVVNVMISLAAAPISVYQDAKILTDQSPVWGDGFSFQETNEHYITTMSVQEDHSVTMVSEKDFSESTIYLNGVDDKNRLIISWFLMIAYGQSVLVFDTVLIHASTVEYNQDEAYAFLGKSGTGKSTHSQLWLKYLDGFKLLNDDNPAIRVFEGNSVYIYGTPWSGKTKCYRNLKVPLKGLVRLNQAKVNRFEPKSNVDALIMLLPSCTAIRWNKMLFNKMVDIIESVVKVTPTGYMDCMINEEAVKVSSNGIKLIDKYYE